MLRVPGSRGDLLAAQVAGRRRPHRLFAARRRQPRGGQPATARWCSSPIGFETTAPPNAMAVWMAQKRRLTNFSVLVSHVLVPPAMTAILEAPDNRVQGFLGPGHVCTVMGCDEYEPIAARFQRADRHHRLRAARPARRGAAGGATARSRPGRGGEPVQPRRAARGQPGVETADRGRFRGLRPQMARRRPASRRAATGCATSTATTTPSRFSRWAVSRPRNRPSASAGRSCAG